jgi:tetratricopeptide (TPR) repeat protein
MSSCVAEAEADVCCANCGIAGVNDIKLKECGGCDLVKYCSDKCREVHREQHEEECNKRKAELHDRKLYSQPEGTHLGECQICFLPLPIDLKKSRLYTCCSQLACRGCVYANYKSNKNEVRRCPFCREPISSDEENRKRNMKRVKANDPAALRYMGTDCYNKGDYDAAFEYWKKAAELEDIEAHAKLGVIYKKGKGVVKDEEKSINHFEIAAIGGHPGARHNLACYERKSGNMERSVKHFVIAAKLGHEKSMKALWKHYSAGNITKEKLEATLRSHQAAIDETKSEQRAEAEEFDRRRSQSKR